MKHAQEFTVTFSVSTRAETLEQAEAQMREKLAGADWMKLKLTPRPSIGFDVDTDSLGL